MKKVVSIAAGVSVAALILAACSSSSSSGSGSSSASGTPKYGGTLKLVGQGDVDYMDTADGYYDTTYTAFRAFVRTLYTYPTVQGGANQVNPVPDLATAMPTVTNGGKTYTITIRQGAMWNTTPPRQVTAEDFIYGLKRLCNPSSPNPAQQYYTQTIQGFNTYCTNFGNAGADLTSINNFMAQNNISGLTATSDRTVQIQLTQPASDFINILSLYFSAPAPKEYRWHAAYDFEHVPPGEFGMREGQDPARYIIELVQNDRFYLGIETEELTMPFALKVLGNRGFLYSSDFPHEVTLESCKHDIAELMESDELTEEDKSAMLYRNAERFYQLKP